MCCQRCEFFEKWKIIVFGQILQLNVHIYGSGPSAGLTFLMERVLYLVIVLSMQNLSINPMPSRGASISIGQMKLGAYLANNSM